MTNQSEHFDIVLANGRVIDPETYLDGIYNVGINGGQIATITKDKLDGKEVVDASNLIVSPGFIDLHAHGQNITSNRVQAFDGLTTTLELEAGILPIGEFYDNCAKEGRPLNYGAAAGWAWARLESMNPEKGKMVPNIAWTFGSFGLKEWTENIPSEKELEQILELTEQGLKEGGIGIGVLHAYCPGAATKELLSLWRLAAKYGRPTYTHIQYVSMVEPKSGTAGIVELMGLAAATGAHTHVCHLNSVSLHDAKQNTDILKRAQADGLKVTTEAYVYGAGCSAIGAAEFDPKDIQERMGISWSDLTLVKNMHDFSSKEEFVEARDTNPGDSVIVHFLREDDNPQDEAMLDLSVMFPGAGICTDSIPWTDASGSFYEGSEWPLPEGLNSHPRAAGNYCRFLRKWVRERGVMSWMDAIRQASLNSALIIEDCAPGMKKKGRLQEGMDADIIVFDPETVTDTATFEEPLQLSKGMQHVIVNGTFLIRDEELDTEAMPGRAVRSPIRN